VPSTDPPDPSGQDGFEWGTYSWNETTGAFSVHVLVDNNGEWGFSNPQGAMTIQVDGNQLTYSEQGGVIVSPTRLEPEPTNSLVGSWVATSSVSFNLLVITFLDDSHYLLAQQGSDPTDPAGHDGIERGTYSWNPANGAFTADVAVDTNGDSGFNTGYEGTIEVNGVTMALQGSTATVSLTRVP
jgi:hypothetical protein